jgi:uncharacterized membrane protein
LTPVTPVVGVPEEEVSVSQTASQAAQHLVEISLAVAGTVFTNVCNRINDTAIDFPAVA